MILTGRALHDFEEWLHKDDNPYLSYFNDSEDPKSVIFRNAVILEWFDTVEYFIILTKITKRFSYDLRSEKDGLVYYAINEFYYTRQEAIAAALVTAEDLYNFYNK